MCFPSGRRRRSNSSVESTRRRRSSRLRTTLSSMTPRSSSPCVPLPRSSARWDRAGRSPSDASDCSTQVSALTSLIDSQHRWDWIWARVPRKRRHCRSSRKSWQSATGTKAAGWVHDTDAYTPRRHDLLLPSPDRHPRNTPHAGRGARQAPTRRRTALTASRLEGTWERTVAEER
jgi:hypothetical protein